MPERPNTKNRIAANLFAHEDLLMARLFNIEGEFPQISPEALSERSRVINYFVSMINDPGSVSVLRSHFGINTEKKSLEQIIRDSGLQPRRVRQLEDKGIRTLKHPSRHDTLSLFLPFNENSVGRKKYKLTCSWDFIKKLSPDAKALEIQYESQEAKIFKTIDQLFREDFLEAK